MKYILDILYHYNCIKLILNIIYHFNFHTEVIWKQTMIHILNHYLFTHSIHYNCPTPWCIVLFYYQLANTNPFIIYLIMLYILSLSVFWKFLLGSKGLRRVNVTLLFSKTFFPLSFKNLTYYVSLFTTALCYFILTL